MVVAVVVVAAVWCGSTKDKDSTGQPSRGRGSSASSYAAAAAWLLSWCRWDMAHEFNPEGDPGALSFPAGGRCGCCLGGGLGGGVGAVVAVVVLVARVPALSEDLNHPKASLLSADKTVKQGERNLGGSPSEERACPRAYVPPVWAWCGGCWCYDRICESITEKN